MPHRHGSHFFVSAGLCWNSASRYPEGVLFDAPNQGNSLPKTFAVDREKIDCTQM